MHAPLPAEARLAALREQVRQIEHRNRNSGHGVLPFGIEAVDRRLAEGGLALAALHEAAAERPTLNDDCAATLFLAGLAARLSRLQERFPEKWEPVFRPGSATKQKNEEAVPDPYGSGTGSVKGQVLWALRRRDLFAPGLASAGLTPDRLIYAECRDDAEILAVMEEGLRHGSLAAVVGEVGRAGMASVRRLQLAAEEGGATALLLRRWRKAGADPLSVPSSAVTRWRIGCAPSMPLPHDGLGRACWRVALERQRGGVPHQWILETPDAEARLALPARPADRPDQARRAA